MTSHLTTHRKPKVEKSFRTHFGEIDEYDTNSGGIISAEFAPKTNNKNFRAFEQAKQLNAQTIGGNHYVLGDMQNIEVHTATDGSTDQQNLEHGLGLLSSVARKGDSADVQVDGIVNIPESQFPANGSNMDQVVEVLIRNNAEDKANNGGSTLSVQMPSGNNQNKIILDPSTQAVTDADGQEIPLDTNTAANLANILQNPEVLAAINNAASTNKLIVIGPVSMFDGSTTQSNQVMTLSSADTSADGSVSASFSQEQLAQISAMVQQDQQTVTSQVSSQTVNDSISATSALAAVESYLQNEQPSSSLGAKNDEIVSNILGSIQPDGKRGPSAVVQSGQARLNNLTISMPPMSQNSLTISPASLGMKTGKLPIMKPLSLQSAANTSSEEVSSSVDTVHSDPLQEDARIAEAEQSNIDENQQLALQQQQQQQADIIQEQEPIEAESTTQPNEFIITNEQYIAASDQGAADSSDMIVTDAEASSSGEPVLLLSTDENGQPQIIVKMPDGSETIMSDPALAESLIQVPTITNAGIEDGSSEAEATQSIGADQMSGTIQLQMPDQGVPDQMEVPSQSGMQPQYVTQSDQAHGEDMQQLPDQSLASASGVESDSVGSSGAVDIIQPAQQSLVSNSTDQSVVQTPDSSSQSYPQTVGEGQIDSRQGLFVMEHVSASDEQNNYPEQSNIDFPQESASDFVVDSSSNTNNVTKNGDTVESSFLQMNDVSQSTNINNLNGEAVGDTENVSSTENTEQ